MTRQTKSKLSLSALCMSSSNTTAGCDVQPMARTNAWSAYITMLKSSFWSIFSGTPVSKSPVKPSKAGMCVRSTWLIGPSALLREFRTSRKCSRLSLCCKSRQKQSNARKMAKRGFCSCVSNFTDISDPLLWDRESITVSTRAVYNVHHIMI